MQTLTAAACTGNPVAHTFKPPPSYSPPPSHPLNSDVIQYTERFEVINDGKHEVTLAPK